MHPDGCDRDRMALDFRAMMLKERAERLCRSSLDASESSPKLDVAPSAPAHRHLAAESNPSEEMYRLPSQGRRRLTASEMICCTVSTIFCLREWITAEEEYQLIRCVDESPAACWTSLRHRRLQQHGGTPEVGGMLPLELPGWLKSVCDALTVAGVFSPELPANHVLVNEYMPGATDEPIMWINIAVS